ncbi:MAG: carbon storage regulator [Planctomycetota bacterium]
MVAPWEDPGSAPPKLWAIGRRKNEAIVIGHGIVVTVLAIRGTTVRLGIDAPGEIAVHREEVQKRIDFETPPLAIPVAGVPPPAILR